MNNYSENDNKYCSSCGEKLSASTLKCSKCGKSISPEQRDMNPDEFVLGSLKFIFNTKFELKPVLKYLKPYLLVVGGVIVFIIILNLAILILAYF